MTTMMTEPAARALTRSARHLIDARLDTIDRMLVGRLPRGDRLAIARDVELQIHELLQERDTESELGRDDVLEVLARLDPPEAFLPEESIEIAGSLPVRLAAVGSSPRVATVPAVSASTAGTKGRAALILGVIGLVLALIAPIGCVLAYMVGEILFIWAGLLVGSLPAFVLGLLALILGLGVHPRTNSSRTGAILGGLALGLSVLGLLATSVVMLLG